MSDSVYRKTPLPVKLNLNDRNTKEQLTGGNPEDTGRGTLEGVSSTSSASESQKNCREVMQKDLQKWLETKGINGPPPSPEAEQRAMWQWIRDFHKEYNDDWFTRNMPRLHERFKPVFNAEMKAMKAQMVAAKAPQPPQNAPACDLLDFDQPVAPPSSEAKGGSNGKAENAMSDLLSLDGPTVPMASAAPVADSASNLVPAANASSAGNGLLDLDLGDFTPMPTVSKAPGANQNTSKQDANLFDLLM